MVPILDRYLIKELVYNLIFVFVVVSSIFIVGIAVKVLYQYSGLNLLAILQVVPPMLLRVLEFLLPLSTLVSVVMVYGRAATENEVTTVKASGIHPYRLFLPALLVAGLLSLMGSYLSFELSPRANLVAKQILKSPTLKAILENKISSGDTAISRDEFTLMWESADTESGTLALRNMVFVRYEEGEEKLVVRAESALVRFDAAASRIVLEPRELRVLKGILKPPPGHDPFFSDVSIYLPLDLKFASARLKYFTGSELRALITRTERGLHPSYPPGQAIGAFHERMAMSMTPILFVLIGAPLALVFRAGDRMVAFLLSVVIALFVHYPSFMLARQLIKADVISPVLAAWSGDLFLLVVGLGLMGFVVRR